MRVIIAGSRSFAALHPDSQLVYIDECVFASAFKIDRVVSGCAQGVDSAAIAWAKKKGIPYDERPAQWDRFGRGAGFKRNAEMLEIADGLIALWDGQSRGTSHMITIARMRGIPVRVYTYDLLTCLTGKVTP